MHERSRDMQLNFAVETICASPQRVACALPQPWPPQRVQPDFPPQHRRQQASNSFSTTRDLFLQDFRQWASDLFATTWDSFPKGAAQSDCAQQVLALYLPPLSSLLNPPQARGWTKRGAVRELKGWL